MKTDSIPRTFRCLCLLCESHTYCHTCTLYHPYCIGSQTRTYIFTGFQNQPLASGMGGMLCSRSGLFSCPACLCLSSCFCPVNCPFLCFRLSWSSFLSWFLFTIPIPITPWVPLPCFLFPLTWSRALLRGMFSLL